MSCVRSVVLFFFFNDTATTEIYTLSLHDALPILYACGTLGRKLEVIQIRIVVPREINVELFVDKPPERYIRELAGYISERRSEEHTSELQSRQYLVCRLLLEKKKRGDLAAKSELS